MMQDCGNGSIWTRNMKKIRNGKMRYVWNRPQGTLKAMPMEPVKVMQTYEPVSVKEVSPGVWLYDFGKNFSGWVRMKLYTDTHSSGKKDCS